MIGLILVLAACDKDTGGDTATDTTDTTGGTTGGTTSGEATATGDWTGTCDYTSSTTSLHYDIDMSLADADGAVTGTMSLTITDSGYSGYEPFGFDLQGTRDGADLHLSATPHVENSTTAGTIDVDGTIDGDDLAIDIVASGTPSTTSSRVAVELSCSLTR